MSNDKAYQLVKRYMNDMFKLHMRYLSQKDLAAWKEQHDRGLAYLTLLYERAGAAEPQQPDLPSLVEQPPLVALPMPELDPDLSLKVDQLDKQIDNANGRGDFARATALRARKGQMMRATGL